MSIYTCGSHFLKLTIMKTLYFVIFNGTSGTINPIKVDKLGEKALIKMFDALDTVFIKANYALCDNKKEAEQTLDSWM